MAMAQCRQFALKFPCWKSFQLAPQQVPVPPQDATARRGGEAPGAGHQVGQQQGAAQEVCHAGQSVRGKFILSIRHLVVWSTNLTVY